MSDYPPRNNQFVYSYIQMSKELSGAINNFQKMFGITAEVWRIDKREIDKMVTVYGSSNVSLRDRSKFKFVKSITILNSPTELAAIYHRNSDEIEVKLGTDELLVGDLIRIPYIDNIILDYFVIDIPKTVAGVYFVYQLKSNFNIINS